MSSHMGIPSSNDTATELSFVPLRPIKGGDAIHHGLHAGLKLTYFGQVQKGAF